MSEFDGLLLSGSDFLAKSKRTVLSRVGRLIALLTLGAAAIVTFTDVWFSDFGAAQTGIDLVLYLVGAVTVFFSMEKDGETSAGNEPGYVAALKRFREQTDGITAEDLPRLREYVLSYVKAEFEHRKLCLMTGNGICEEEYAAYLAGRKCSRGVKKKCRKIKALKPSSLTANSLLSLSADGRSELCDPQGKRTLGLLSKLLPSLICMCLTVAVAIKIKDGMTADVILSGIFRLSALLGVGAKGYIFGYRYVSENLTAWLSAKTKLLESFAKRGA
ncbi:MAG: hypothetical protein MJ082_05240 [Clostridia bacterium]|nr:hypothetical protein [Clostridia bacterium]